MSCQICQNKVYSLKEAEARKIGLELSKMQYKKLSQFYQHIFSFCSVDGIPDIDFSKDEIEIIKNNMDKIKEIYYGETLRKNAVTVMAKICEIKGFISELSGDNIGAMLGYKACTDLIDLELHNYFMENGDKIVTKGGGKSVVIRGEEVKRISKYRDKNTALKYLIIKTSSKCFRTLGFLAILIYVDCCLDVGVKDNLSQMVEMLVNEDKIEPELKPVVQDLKNKYLYLKDKKD